VTNTQVEGNGHDGRLGEIIRLSGQLASLMTEETELLRKMRIAEIEPLQSQKSALAAAYASAITAVGRRPDQVTDAPADLRQSLREATRSLQTALDQNMRAVLAAKTVNERLIRVVSDAVAEMRAPGGAYTANGCAPSSADAAEPISLSVDHRA